MTPPGADGTTGRIGRAGAPALGCNTFAVPVLTGVHLQRRVVWRPQGPLVPWQVAGAEDLWVPVDDTERQFERFVQEGPQPHLITDPEHNAGFLVVVSGAPRGGKTTFLHKSVHHLAQRLEAAFDDGSIEARRPQDRWTVRGHQPSHVRVVPIGGQANDAEAIAWQEDGTPAPLEVVNHRILDRVRKALGKDFPLEAAEYLKEDLVYEAYDLLSESLVNIGRTLLIVLPDFRWNDEDLTKRFYRSCHHNARTGIVFFSESSSSDTRDDLVVELGEDLSRLHTIHLEIGPLRREDWIRFVQARHMTSTIPGPHVRLADDVLHGELDPWMWKDIGTLQRILCDVTQQAFENEETEIDMERLRLYSRDHRPPGTRDFRRPQ